MKSYIHHRTRRSICLTAVTAIYFVLNNFTFFFSRATFYLKFRQFLFYVFLINNVFC